MIKEEVIVITVPVKVKGEHVHFQQSLPNGSRIIGLEYGVTGVNGILPPFLPPTVIYPFNMVSEKIIGRLTLQAPVCGGIFFIGNLVEDRNYFLGDEVGGLPWLPEVWTHGGTKTEIELDVKPNIAFIEGYFKDSYGAALFAVSLEYQLNLSLWIEKCIP